MTIIVLHLFYLSLLLSFLYDNVEGSNKNNNIDNDSTSEFSRSMASQNVYRNNPKDPIITRRHFSISISSSSSSSSSSDSDSDSDNDDSNNSNNNNNENDSYTSKICIAFLSCCDRIDLLNATMYSLIRHMEYDEPSTLQYEIAWVDNGSSDTSVITDNYEIDHVLTLRQNTGLAYGMNLLIYNLCKDSEYILLMEEDWLYLDDIVADQTVERKRSIATSIALTELNLQSYDERTVMGVFLRPETYGSFMKWPNQALWEIEHNVNLYELNVLSSSSSSSSSFKDENKDLYNNITITYQVYCGDRSLKSGNIWGSYTNGVGLYKRKYLLDIGRMYGEPGDAFHPRYVESNYAYRASLHYCHAAIHLASSSSSENDDNNNDDDDNNGNENDDKYKPPKCNDISNKDCTAAFHHIGGGRGTMPQTTDGTKCAGEFWFFYGTPMYDKYIKFQKYINKNGKNKNDDIITCTDNDIKEFKLLDKKLKDSEEYKKQVKEINKIAFEKELKQRQSLIKQANIIRNTLPNILRNEIEWMSNLSDIDIINFANKIEKYANSKHPLDGFWDSHGRPLQ